MSTAQTFFVVPFLNGAKEMFETYYFQQPRRSHEIHLLSVGPDLSDVAIRLAVILSSGFILAWRAGLL